jgi:hypothetical protein
MDSTWSKPRLLKRLRPSSRATTFLSSLRGERLPLSRAVGTLQRPFSRRSCRSSPAVFGRLPSVTTPCRRRRSGSPRREGGGRSRFALCGSCGRTLARCAAKKRAPLRRGSTHIYSGLGDPGSPTSGSSGIVGGSGAVPGSCSGIVPGSAGIGSSGVGRSGVGPGSCVAISVLPSLVGDLFTRYATLKTAKNFRRAAALPTRGPLKGEPRRDGGEACGLLPCPTVEND